MSLRKTRVKTTQNVRDNLLLPTPVDLVTEIFSRLPVKSIARCRCVSKPWASMLRSPDFTELFLTRSSARPRLLFSCQDNGKLLFFSAPQVQNPHQTSSSANCLMKFTFDRSFEICGSVCGLLCFVHVPILNRRTERELLICNPSTGQSKMVSFKGYCFVGYDPIGRQFKLLSMASSEQHKVLTLGTEKPSWRKTECCTPHIPYNECKAICINGILYYSASVNRSLRISRIICFDVTTEKYSFVKLREIGDFTSTLVNYKGKMAAFSARGTDFVSGTSTSFQMWVLEDPGKQEWSKHVFALPPMWKNVVADHPKFYFVGVTGTNEILLSPRSTSVPFYIFYYNIEKKTIRRVEIQGMDAFESINVNTFVDYVEDVKLIDMFRTYNLRFSNRS